MYVYFRYQKTFVSIAALPPPASSPQRPPRAPLPSFAAASSGDHLRGQDHHPHRRPEAPYGEERHRLLRPQSLGVLRAAVGLGGPPPLAKDGHRAYSSNKCQFILRFTKEIVTFFYVV